ncbi:unnamed protein product [Gongylonema pulchrum]|uniref:Neur_chan_memb domain-containing protein n=1 Tax=Gongylonema pulchrum TaxID=637853 RepID=A0A183DVB1_9BILA|nr:unnamed protein product [Gongylonema pulchrum]
MLFVPLGMQLIAPRNTAEEWSMVFLFTAIVLIITNVIFCVFGRGEACKWTTEEFIIKKATSTPELFVTSLQQASPGKVLPQPVQKLHNDLAQCS